MDVNKLSYEESIKELETLIERLKVEDLTLEESVNDFKKANILYNHCKELLDKAEGEIKIILEDENGEQIESDFSQEGEYEF